jgi:hypothetical protein
MRTVVFALVCLAAPALAPRALGQEEPAAGPSGDDNEVPGEKSAKEPPASDGDSEKSEKASGARETGLKLNPGGVYGGVAPGATHLPPKAPRLPLRRGPQRMTWSGFQVKEGVPTVFVETTGVPEYTVAERPGEVIVTLKNTVVPIKNNRRPLRVEAFQTGVKSVDTDQKGKDTRIVIHTKDAGAPSHKERVEAAAGGFQMLLIELPGR